MTGERKYCNFCNTAYRKHHKCHYGCPDCRTMGIKCPRIKSVSCVHCGRFFRSAGCLQRHLTPYEETIHKGRKRIKVTTSTCEKFKRCSICSRTVPTELLLPEKHKCGLSHCKHCRKDVPTIFFDKHKCYMRKLKASPKESEKKVLCV